MPLSIILTVVMPLSRIHVRKIRFVFQTVVVPQSHVILVHVFVQNIFFRYELMIQSASPLCTAVAIRKEIWLIVFVLHSAPVICRYGRAHLSSIHRIMMQIFIIISMHSKVEFDFMY